MAGESFAMVVFAAEWPTHPELHPVKNHIFAAFVHERPGGEMETSVISWLPRSGIIDGLLQVGVNYPLPETLDWCERGGMAIYAWHAYEIRDVLFASAQRRIAALESGDLRYYFFGTGPRNLNCTHALSGLDLIETPDVPLVIYGVPASRACLDRMVDWSWPAANPGKYEDALNLPAKKINWLDHGTAVREVEPIDPAQFQANCAKELPGQTKGDER